jgi:hypothetical protein
MDKITTLQIKIEEAKEKLSKETRRAIDSVNWKTIILGINKQYNSLQLEELETETELLLCGLTNPDDYIQELEMRMKIPKSEVSSLINEIDRLIFRKIQEELEKILKDGFQTIEKPFTPDPRFANTPIETQKAISYSEWETNLREIAKKYKLSIDKMDPLEKITINVINGSLATNNYESELKPILGLSTEDNHNLVEDVNDKILKTIKEALKEHWNNKKNIDDVPLPPYKTIKNEELGIRNEKMEDVKIENKQVEEKLPEITSIKTETTPIQIKEVVAEIKPIKTPSAIDILKEKLTNTTTSNNTVSDYSLPKMSGKLDINPISPVVSRANSHDPYHEEI